MQRHVRARTGLVAALTTAVAAAVLSTPVPALAATSAGSLDTGSRQAVTEAYRALWEPATTTPLRVDGGDPSSCTPYRTSAATQARTKDAINFARRLAGMQPVTTVSDPHTAAASVSALLQAVNQTLTHNPAQSLLCWTAAAAAAAGHSNLDLRWSTSPSFVPTVADIVGDYLVDRGSNNTEVGHRRWVLLPGTTTMGSGNAVVTNATGVRYVANNLWVVGSQMGDTPAGTPAFYGWPTAGWFPSPLEPEGRWSLSSSTGASFSHATVQVSHNGVAVPVTVQPYGTGYGDNTLVWQLDQPAAVSGSAAQTYDVTVRGISGASRSSYSYAVRLFDPSWTDPSWPSGSGAISTRAPIAHRSTSVQVHRASSRVHRHHRPRLTVAVGGPGTPQGQVVVRLDGHRVGAWTLHDGRRTVRLPRLGRLGRHHVVVRYPGHDGWAPSTARTVLRVVR